MTEVRKIRIAVISADVSFADFFAWEARACDCPVEIFTEVPPSLMEFDFAVLDLRVGVCLPDNPMCRLAVVLSDGAEKAYSMADFVWEMPIAVETVRDAYVQALGRQEEVSTVERETRELAIYVLSECDFTVMIQNRTVRLTESEWRMLMLLGERAGAVVPKEVLAAALNSSVGNAMNVHICHLRQKLETPIGVRVLKTVRGGGYRLTVPLKRWGE